jgi:hypothetical protein
VGRKDICQGQQSSSSVTACAASELGCGARVLGRDAVALDEVTGAAGLEAFHLSARMDSTAEAAVQEDQRFLSSSR